MRPLRLGTRRSLLATTQSEWAADALRREGHEVELVEITTHGDVSKEPLAVIGGTGVFVSALREALLAGTVDLAVHSLKDLPTAPADGLVLGAVPQREDPRDVLVAAGRTLAALPQGATVGTGSPRRRALLLDLRPDLEVVAIRGNIDTRLRMVGDGRLDGVVLAAAGLNRIGRLGEASELLDPAGFVPAPGQGALAVECRSGDAEVRAALTALESPADRLAVAAERCVLGALEAGCSAPVGAHATSADGVLTLLVAVGGLDGLVRREVSAPVTDEAGAVALGSRLAADLLAEGLSLPPRASRPGTTPTQPTPTLLAHPQDHPRPRHDTESGS
ncbi:hydroxymethylbilane synthase [Kineococcus rubinsiae]|uniref:hydroxymethylbilane synthase n=1 Tax=Kineococcus rubinsiae TaxID=2609562 RepID=UPI0014319106|nr:hydroxymethylbilane synthase [Kineococcus rubinsiae]NIZ92231.1 hydroxymethylbilane synthase [Kineococcus rubinsiae]